MLDCLPFVAYNRAQKEVENMSIRYYKLFDLLNRRGMKKSDLRSVISSATVAKLSKGEYISGEAIDKICAYLQCQPGDIMEYVEVATEIPTGKEAELAVHREPKTDDIVDVNVYPVQNK